MIHIFSFSYQPHLYIKDSEEGKHTSSILHTLHSIIFLSFQVCRLSLLSSQIESSFRGVFLYTGMLSHLCRLFELGMTNSLQLFYKYTVYFIFNIRCIIHVFSLGLLHLSIPFPRIPGPYNILIFVLFERLTWSVQVYIKVHMCWIQSDSRLILPNTGQDKIT